MALTETALEVVNNRIFILNLSDFRAHCNPQPSSSHFFSAERHFWHFKINTATSISGPEQYSDM